MKIRFVYSIVVLFSLWSCNIKLEKTEGLDSKKTQEWTILENAIGGIEITANDLNLFEENLGNVNDEITIKKEVLIEGGREFTMLTVTKENEVLFLASSSYDNENEIEQIIFQNKNSKDEYGVSVGLSLDEAKVLRPNLKLHADEHLNIFAFESDSNISYLLKGSFSALDAENDKYVADDFSVEESQVEDMVIEKILWTKR